MLHLFSNMYLDIQVKLEFGRTVCLTDPIAHKPDTFTQTQSHLLVPGQHRKKTVNNLQTFILLLQSRPLFKI